MLVSSSLGFCEIEAGILFQSGLEFRSLSLINVLASKVFSFDAIRYIKVEYGFRLDKLVQYLDPHGLAYFQVKKLGKE
jgi:hypothetical protein